MRTGSNPVTCSASHYLLTNMNTIKRIAYQLSLWQVWITVTIMAYLSKTHHNWWLMLFTILHMSLVVTLMRTRYQIPRLFRYIVWPVYHQHVIRTLKKSDNPMAYLCLIKAHFSIKEPFLQGGAKRAFDSLFESPSQADERKEDDGTIIYTGGI